MSPEHVAALAERLARDRDRGAVDLGGALALAVAVQHDPAGAEGVRQQHVGARLHVAPLDREHALGVVEVPGLAAAARLEPRALDLGAHGAVAEQHALAKRLEQATAGSRADLHAQTRTLGIAAHGARRNAQGSSSQRRHRSSGVVAVEPLARDAERGERASAADRARPSAGARSAPGPAARPAAVAPSSAISRCWSPISKPPQPGECGGSSVSPAPEAVRHSAAGRLQHERFRHRRGEAVEEVGLVRPILGPGAAHLGSDLSPRAHGQHDHGVSARLAQAPGESGASQLGCRPRA